MRFFNTVVKWCFYIEIFVNGKQHIWNWNPEMKILWFPLIFLYFSWPMVSASLAWELLWLQTDSNAQACWMERTVAMGCVITAQTDSNAQACWMERTVAMGCVITAQTDSNAQACWMERTVAMGCVITAQTDSNAQACWMERTVAMGCVITAQTDSNAASSLHRQTAMPRSVSLLHAMACHLTCSVPSHHLNQCSKQISSSATFQPLKQSWVQSLAWQVEPNFCCTDLAGIWLPLLKNVYNISYFPVHFILMA